MTGLSQITDAIIAEAKKEAEEKLSAAKKCADDIKSEYAAEAEHLKAEAEQKQSAAVEAQKERSEAAKKSYYGEKMLEMQRKTAKELIDAAKKAILSMDADEYFAYLAKIYKNLGEDGTGELLLTKADRERMPAGFVKNLGESLVLSEEDAPSAGFIIRHGRVEQNCTIDAMFRDRENELYDIAGSDFIE